MFLHDAHSVERLPFEKEKHAETVSPDEGVIKGGDEDPAGVVCHELLSVFNAFI